MKQKRQVYEREQTEGEYTITLHVNGICLSLCWSSSHPRSPWLFEGIWINDVNLRILTETDLMNKIARLSPTITPVECLQLLQQWGFRPID